MTVNQPTQDGQTRQGADGGPGVLIAGLLIAAAVIHFAMVPVHAGSGLTEPLGFAIVGWFQLVVAGVILVRGASRSVLWTAIIGNAVIIGLWVLSRTAGLPVGAHAGEGEPASLIDGMAVGLEAAAILVAFALIFTPTVLRIGQVVAIGMAVGVIGLATVAIVSPDAADHDHSGDTALGSGGASGGHHGGGAASTETHLIEMDAVDGARCDLAFNPASFWSEAEDLGVDTYSGGKMAAHSETTLLETVGAQPLGGRGSAQLDKLVSLSGQLESEAAAAQLVSELSNSTEREYDAWKQWMAGTAGGHGEHGGSASGDDTGGHGGHLGPTPWTAMVDQRQCDRLTAEVELARETALTYPTAADATAGGWTRVTGYVPGIAAHYMNFGYVDGTFEVDKPEMLLYDGGGPEARVVGLSYYVLFDSEAEPTQGFTGENDHYHRHIGLCLGAGGVIGDSTTTKEDCEARGGVKQGGGAGWMSHAWVVPGCESPWGLFSGASPMLDSELAKQSGTNDGNCSASGVRDRYDLSPGPSGGSNDLTGSASRR